MSEVEYLYTEWIYKEINSLFYTNTPPKVGKLAISCKLTQLSGGPFFLWKRIGYYYEYPAEQAIQYKKL